MYLVLIPDLIILNDEVIIETSTVGVAQDGVGPLVPTSVAIVQA